MITVAPIVMSIDQLRSRFEDNVASIQARQLQDLLCRLNENEWKHRVSASTSYDNLQRTVSYYEDHPEIEVPEETLNLFKTAIEYLRQYA